MDVAADHAVDLAPMRLVGHCLLEGADESDRRFHPILEVGRQRPIAEAEMAAHPVQRIVQPTARARSRGRRGSASQLGGAHDDVELVAVHHEVAAVRRPPWCGRGPGGSRCRRNAGRRSRAGTSSWLPGMSTEARALAHACRMQLLHHVVVRLRPMRTAPHAPEIDDVADQIDHIGLHVLQELEEQRPRLRRARAQMHIGDEQGPHVGADVGIGEVGVARISHEPLESGFGLQGCDRPGRRWLVGAAGPPRQRQDARSANTFAAGAGRRMADWPADPA